MKYPGRLRPFIRRGRGAVALVAAGAIVASSFAAAGVPSGAEEPNIPAPAAAVAHDPAGVVPGAAVRQDGKLSTDGPREVNLSAVPDAPDTLESPTPAKDMSPRRIDGSRPIPTPPATNGGPLSGKVGGPSPQVSAPNLTKQNFAGTKSSQSSCGCQPPDPNGAVSNSYIVEADNLSLQTWSRTGTPTTPLKRVSLNTFLGTSDSLSDPRVMYDNAFKRWVLFVIVVPASSSDTPALWIAASQNLDPRGNWWIYRPGFSGGFYPPGTLLDYPMVGMDQDAVLFSTNNFFPAGYNNTAVLGIPKQRIYNGLGFAASAFQVAYSAHPAIVEGIPQNGDPVTYIVASQLPYGNSGFDIYEMSSSSRSPNVFYVGAASSPAISPPNCGVQPGGGNCLDALDGRLQAAPKQLNGQVWWTRAAGFPVIEYGVINPASPAASAPTSTRAVAYKSGSSYDWNPSIAVSDAGGGNNRVFLSWAYTDPGAGTNVSLRYSGLNAGDAVQNLIGIGTTAFTGSHGNDFRFGDFSSTMTDPALGGKGALAINEVFAADGSWQNRIVRFGFP